MKVAVVSALALAGSASAFVPAAPRGHMAMKAEGKFGAGCGWGEPGRSEWRGAEEGRGAPASIGGGRLTASTEARCGRIGVVDRPCGGPVVLVQATSSSS